MVLWPYNTQLNLVLWHLHPFKDASVQEGEAVKAAKQTETAAMEKTTSCSQRVCYLLQPKP